MKTSQKSDAVSAATLTPSALETWLGSYKQAWELRDAERAAALFTADARYHEMPFDPPKLGREGIREYWTTVTADQRNIQFKSQVLDVGGRTGIAHWSATFESSANGARIDLDWVFVLSFAADGLCSELREWWHVRATAP
jgi:ketosteroid isomerase-like protein